MYFKSDVMICFDAVVKTQYFFSKMTMFEWKNQVLGYLKTLNRKIMFKLCDGLKSSISSHSEPCTMACMRLLKCFVLIMLKGVS